MKQLLAILLATATVAAAGDLLISHMEDGDRVEVTLHSTGCFHDTTSYYEVSRGRGSHFFTEFEIIWDKGSPRRIVEKKALGRIRLGKREVRGLDGLLRFYRGEKEATSTTQVSLVVQYYEPDGLVRLERLRDGSDGYGLEKRRDVIAFDELAGRFEVGESAKD